MKRLLLWLWLVTAGVVLSAPPALSTVNEVTARNTYTGDATTTVFSYTFKIFAKTDIAVYVGSTLKTVDTDYSVSGLGASGGGSVTFTSAPASATTITLLRKQALSQGSTYVPNEAFPSTRIEKDFDKNLMVDQRQQEELTRTLKLPINETGTSALTTWPSLTSRASKYLGFDASGNPVALAVPAGTTAVSAFMATVLDDATATAAKQTLLLDKHGADIASAATIDLDGSTGDLVDVTGTTTITAVTLAEGVEKTVRFTGVLTLTHGASLVLPGSANITTAAGDVAVFRGYASSVVRVVSYQKLSGAAIVATTDATLTTTDITTNDCSTAKHGFAPKAPNDTTKYLRGDCTWAVPAGSGTLTAGTALSLTSLAVNQTFGPTAHGLGTRPKFFEFIITNGTGDCGYSAGDIIVMNASLSDSPNNSSIAIIPDATNVTAIITNGSTLSIPNKSTRAACAITGANWTGTVTPYRLN